MRRATVAGKWLVAVVAGGAVLALAASCGRQSGVEAVRDQAAGNAPPAAVVAGGAPSEAAAPAGSAAAKPPTLGAAYERFLSAPVWSEEYQEPLKFVVVRGRVRGLGDSFEGWFTVGNGPPAPHHFVVAGKTLTPPQFTAYVGGAALRQALR
ncbi:MAG: hypothetical protein WC708_19500 [Lentisphaeria bacterium]